MTPLRVLKQAVSTLEEKGFLYCLIGGHAASLYRKQVRLTRDVDFALLAEPVSKSQTQAEEIIKSIGLKPIVGFIPTNHKDRTRKSVRMVSSAPARKNEQGIIDILLPVLPWVAQAVKRAQYNKINLGFASVPVITPEDLILAKCYALNNSPDRFQDLDDLKEIFACVKDLNLNYLRVKLAELTLEIPDPVKKFSPL